MSATSSNIAAVGREFGLDQGLYPINDAARLLGISRSFVYELVASGDLEILHVGAKPLVPSIAIAKLIEQRLEAARAKRAATATQKASAPRSRRRS
jgi:excisionase family DNA binding protein